MSSSSVCMHISLIRQQDSQEQLRRRRRWFWNLFKTLHKTTLRIGLYCMSAAPIKLRFHCRSLRSYHLDRPDHLNSQTKIDRQSFRPLRWVPTADQINSIKPDQAIGNRSGKWSGVVGIDRVSYTISFDCRKKSSRQALEKRSGSDRVLVE